MKRNGFSRRDFIVKVTAGLGYAVAFELGGFGGAHAAEVPAVEKTREKAMPHVSVKLWPGRSEEEKHRLAEAIAEDVVRITGCGEGSVSVTIEDVPPDQWKEKVYDPKIRDKADLLYRKPGYSM